MQQKELVCYDPLRGRHDVDMRKILTWLEDQTTADLPLGMPPCKASEFKIRYEEDLPKQGRSLDCALFLCGYATDLLRQGPMDFQQGKMQQFREARLKTLESIGVTNPTAKEFFEATSDAAAAASVKADAQAAPTSGMAGLPSRQGVNEASTGRPVTRGAAAARCSPDVTISSSESGEEALSPDTAAAATTLAQMTARDAHPDADEDGNCHSSDDSDGPHKQIRQEGLQTLKKTRARMVQNYNRQSRVRSFQVGDCVGVKVDRADRGHCDRKFVPCLIIGVNRRQQFQLRCEDGVIETRHTAGDLQPFPSTTRFFFAAGDSIEGVQQLKVIQASRLQSHAKVTAVSCKCGTLQCSTKRCRCFAAGVECTARCHAGKKCQH